MHGTSGLSYRGVYYPAALNRAGIATLEIAEENAARDRSARTAPGLF
jgi:hypothetical protein